MAIAHDYLTQRGGAERVVLAMARAFPDAPIYTTLYAPEHTFPEFQDLDVRVSPLNVVRPLRRYHRLALPMLPFTVQRTKIDADIVLASSSGWAHGVKTRGKKIVYCYSPARWLYQLDRYLGDHPILSARLAIALLGPSLRRWDQRSAREADEYLAISSAVRERIRHTYDRSATVVAAPFSRSAVDERPGIAPSPELEPGFYLCVSRLLPYKNIAAIVDAFAGDPDRRLVVVGAGPEAAHLRERAGDNVRFFEALGDSKLAWLYHHCRALIAVGYEDYGLTPIEAAAAGKPSIVLNWGGYLDTMVEGKTAVFVDTPKPGPLREAMVKVETTNWDERALTDHAESFSEPVFIERIREVVLRHAPHDA